MANSSLILSSIDFDTLKANFKEFLKTQSTFKDYDFDGSNISVLLDVMAYNSYLNAFYLNMIGSEMFLDSAQKYDSVISHAKELNYVARSRRSSVAEVDLSFETINVDTLTIPKGARFAGINSNGSYTFTTSETTILTSSNSTFSIANLQIFEGDYFQDSYVVDYDIETQQYLITNPDVDVNSITVNVVENNGASNTEFKRAETLFGLSDTSEIFFLQSAQNNTYEVVFGDGLFGRKPLNASTIIINYRVSSAESSDGISSFILVDDLNDSNEGDVDLSSIVTSSNSSSGAERENIESIRFSAPRYFATQQRAISNDDYSSLILTGFGGEISDVVVYGGETVEPKQYGRVIVSLKPKSGINAPDYVKNNVVKYLKDFIPLPNRIIISDPDYLFCSVSSTVQFDPNITTKSAADIEVLARQAIKNYSLNNLEKFGDDLRYSRLVNTIDNSDLSVVSNNTELRIIKRINPIINTPTTYDLEVDNPLYYDSTIYTDSEQHTLIHENELDARTTHAALISSRFTYNATDGRSYPLSFFEDDANGNIVVFTTIGDSIVPIETVGTVNYNNGNIKLNNINISNYNNYVSIYLRGRRKDILATKNKIIQIDPRDVLVDVIEVLR